MKKPKKTQLELMKEVRKPMPKPSQPFKDKRRKLIDKSREKDE